MLYSALLAVLLGLSKQLIHSLVFLTLILTLLPLILSLYTFLINLFIIYLYSFVSLFFYLPLS